MAKEMAFERRQREELGENSKDFECHPGIRIGGPPNDLIHEGQSQEVQYPEPC